MMHPIRDPLIWIIVLLVFFGGITGFAWTWRRADHLEMHVTHLQHQVEYLARHTEWFRRVHDAQIAELNNTVCGANGNTIAKQPAVAISDTQKCDTSVDPRDGMIYFAMGSFFVACVLLLMLRLRPFLQSEWEDRSHVSNATDTTEDRSTPKKHSSREVLDPEARFASHGPKPKSAGVTLGYI